MINKLIVQPRKHSYLRSSLISDPQNPTTPPPPPPPLPPVVCRPLKGVGKLEFLKVWGSKRMPTIAKSKRGETFPTVSSGFVTLPAGSAAAAPAARRVERGVCARRRAPAPGSPGNAATGRA